MKIHTVNNFKLCSLCLLTGLLFSNLVSAKFIAVSVSEEDNFRNILSSNMELAVNERNNTSFIDTAGGDFSTQLRQVKSFAAAGADAIIIMSAGSPEQNLQLFEVAKQVPLVFVNYEPVADLKGMPANTAYVGSNEEQSGTLQMEEIAKLANYKGKIALLIGEVTHPAAKVRTQDVKNVIAKYPGLQIVESKSANWQRNQAYQVVSDWIKNKVDFNILVANNDEMIIGGIMALKDAGLDPKKYLTGGIDATPDALAEMDQGNLTVTVLQDAVGQARSAVDVTYKMINKEPIQTPYWVPFRLITKDNYAEIYKK